MPALPSIPLAGVFITPRRLICKIQIPSPAFTKTIHPPPHPNATRGTVLARVDHPDPAPHSPQSFDHLPYTNALFSTHHPSTAHI